MRLRQTFVNYLAIPFIFAAFLIFICGIQVSQAGVCDVDADCNIDKNDINLINAARNKPASGPDDPRDADRDGKITVLDARKCIIKCTKPRCAIVAPSCVVQDIDKDGFTTSQGDCDDNNSAVYPGAAEVCNSVDDNCSGQVDEGVLNACGFCGSVPAETCDGIDNDCDGSVDEGVLNACGHCGPVPVESCDGIDNNCDGQKDEGFDADNDKFTTCGGDCNDNNPAINPAAFEIPNNDIDENCSGGDLVARPPQITVPDSFDIDEGGTLEFDVTASDPNGDAVNLSASPKISNSGFTATNGVAASGAYSFNPDHSQQGIYNVTFTATDPLGYKGIKTVTITVNNVNRAPGLTVEPQWNIKEGEALAIPVQASDTDNDILSLKAFVQPEDPDKPLPDNAMFIEATGTLTFTPDFTQAGVYDIVFEASDGELSSGPQTAHIIIDDVPDANVPGELILNVDPVESPTLLKTLRVTGSVNASSTPPQVPVTTVLITGMDPTTGQQGETLNVTLTGESSGRYASNFEQGKSQANFGDGITVNSLTVNSPTEAVVNITIDPSAAEGTRSVMLTTDKEVAVSVLAFSVTQGASQTTGNLTDNETGQPLAGVVITIQGTNITTITNADGSFTLNNVPPGQYTLIINAPDHVLITIDFDSQVGTTVDLGDIKPQANVFDPQAPPAATVFSIAGRGVGDVSFENSTVEEVEQLVVDTIIAVGGTEAGVLDAYGNQLNPNVTGDGIVSLRHRGMQNLAMNLITGDSRSLGEILTLFLRSFDYKGQPVPRLMDVLSAIQQQVDSSWSNPRDGSPLIMVLFNQKRSLLGDPPKINLDTNLNSLQTYLLVTSLMTFVHNQVPALPPSGMLQNNLFAFADTAFNDSAYDASPFLLAQAGPGNGGAGGGSGAYSIVWETVFDTAKAGFIDNLKNKGIEICKKLTDVQPATCGDGQVQAGEDCDGTPGCAANCQFAIKPTPPGCKETAELAMILIDDMGDAATGASEKFGQFFLSEGATNLTAQRLQQEYQSESFKDAWAESKKEAQSMGKLTKLVEFSSGFIQDQLNNVQGAIIGSILDLQAELIIESLRPDPPLIKKIEQMRDPSNGELSTTVKITFLRSQKDDGNTGGNKRWFYELWREQNGRVARITSGRVRTPEQGPGPRPTEDPRTLVFYDVDSPEGSSLYRIRSVRMIGIIVADEPPNVIDTIFQMASGFVPLNFATPGGTTVMGGDTLKMLLDPAAKILQGIKIQKSDFSDVQPIFVSLKERPPSPPANLAVDPHKGVTYMSIPALSRIFKVNDGDITDFANAGFKAPYQIGLGIDSIGNLYTDNAASDMQFGGRIFKFDGNTTARSFIGTTNYYSFLLQYAKAAMVQAAVIGPSQYGQALYIADGLSNSINQLRLPESLPEGMDLSRNVSQPYAQSSLFNFGPNTAMAFRGDGTMLVTNNDNLLFIPAGGGTVDPLFNDTNAQSPYQQLSGVTVDRMGNVYVSDSQLGTVTMLPINAQLPNIGLMGYDDAGKKRLTFVRGLNRPSQIQLAPDARGLVFFDANGLHKIGFGMSGQVTGVDGSPLAGAKVMTNDRETTLISVTDGDGVYVMPGLIEKNNNVVEISIRYNNETQTQRVVLDSIQHNLVDFVFNPPPPPDGNEDIQLSSPPVPAPPPVEIDVKSGDTIILDTQVSLSKVMPNQNPPPAEDIITRAHILSPGNDVPVTDSTVSVRGFVNDPAITEGTLIVNGVEQEITITNGEFEAPAQLQPGGNDIVVRVPEGGVKGEFVRETDRNLIITENEINEIGVTFGDALAAPASFTGGAIDPLITKLEEQAPAQAGEIRTDYQSARNQALSVLTPLLEGRLPEQEAVDLLKNSTAALAAKTSAFFGAEAKAQSGTGGMLKGITRTMAAQSSEINTILQGIGPKFTAAVDGIAAREIGLKLNLQSFMQAAPAGPARDQVEQAANSYLGSLQPVKEALGAKGLPSNTHMLVNTQTLQVLSEAVTNLEGQFDNAASSIMQNFKTASEGVTAFIGTSTDEAAADIGGAAAKTSSLAGKAVDSLYSDIATAAQVTLPAEFTAQVGDTKVQAETLSSQFTAGQLPARDAFDVLKTNAQAVETSARTTMGQISAMTRNLVIGAAAEQSVFGAQATLIADIASARIGVGVGKIGQTMINVLEKIGKVQNLPKERVPPSFERLATILTGEMKDVLDNLNLKRLPDELSGNMSKNFKDLFRVDSAALQVPKVSTTEAANAHMEKTGVDLTIAGRVKDRDTNLPVAGFKMKVPGTDFETSTDADGVYQMQLKLSKLQDCMALISNMMKQQHGTMKAVISNLRGANDIFDLSRMYAQAGGGGGVVFDDQGMSSFILSAIKLQEMLPNCSSNGDGIKDISRRLEELSTAAYSRIEAGDEMTADEKLEMQSKLDEMQQLFETLSTIMKSEHDTSMNIIMNIK